MHVKNYLLINKIAIKLDNYCQASHKNFGNLSKGNTARYKKTLMYKRNIICLMNNVGIKLWVVSVIGLMTPLNVHFIIINIAVK